MKNLKYLSIPIKKLYEICNTLSLAAIIDLNKNTPNINNDDDKEREYNPFNTGSSIMHTS
jgi:hypothetical protein